MERLEASYLSYFLNQLHEKSVDKKNLDDLKGSACVIYGGGVETTYSALSHFILEMVVFPDVQKRAQDEIDRVIGRSRLPEFSDRDALTYIDAILHEVLRWNTVAPSGFPHRSVEDDVYNGMFIPKGTVVIANSYAILRDESIYADPDSFNPSKYLPKPEGNGKPYPLGQFGFGRRICPGQYFAEASLWIAIASILATLDINRAVDDKGNEIVPDIDLNTGIMSHPKPFVCFDKATRWNVTGFDWTIKIMRRLLSIKARESRNYV